MHNKHVIKMILESAQMLCTAFHELGYSGAIPYKKAYVKVNNKKVFLRAINDYQREQIVKSFIDAGKGRPTEQQIAEYWVREGMPRDDGKGSKTPVYNKNGDIEASDTGNTRKYVQTFNIMG